MSNYNNITARWDRGTLSEAIISRQYDDAATLVAFAGVPTGDDDEDAVYHLIVWMATEEGGEPHEQAPILLDAPEWLISNFYTQFTQVIRFQLCIQTEGGAYEAHSPIFSGRIARSLRHDGTTDDINTSVLFDPYKKYVDEKAMAAGAVVIDAALDANSTNPVQNKIVAGAITELNERLVEVYNTADTLGYYSKKITTVADSAHSSDNDRLSVTISSGDDFYITALTADNANISYQVFGYNGESVQSIASLKTDIGRTKLTAGSDIISIGIYVGALSSGHTITVIVEKADSIQFMKSELAQLNESIPFLTYQYTKGDVRSGSLQYNGTVSASSDAYALKNKIPLAPGGEILITPTILDTGDFAKVRIVCYTSEDSTAGTIKTVAGIVPDGGYIFIQPSGYTHILVGLYYKLSDGTSHDDILDDFTDSQNVLTIVDYSKRTQIVYESEIEGLTQAIEKAQTDATNALNVCFDYYPIALTAVAGWFSGNAIYSTNAHYHIDLPVESGEKYHIRSRTDNPSVPRYIFTNQNGGSISYAEGTTTLSDDYVTVPDGAVTLTVNSHHYHPVTIEKYTSEANAVEIEPYFYTEAADCVTKMKTASTEKALIFAVVTDSHVHYDERQVWDDTVKNIIKVNDLYQIDGIVHLGDIINGDIAKTQEIEILDYIRNGLRKAGESVSYLEGNHDLNSFYSDNTDPITETEMYANMFRFNAAEIIRPDGKLYGYRDFDAYGIRVVYLLSSLGDGTHGGRGDNWGYPLDELTWVENVALDTTNQVLFLSHMMFTEGTISTSSTLPQNGNLLKGIVDNFIEGGGIVIGLIHGHTHWDYIYDTGRFKEVSIAAEMYQYKATDSAPSSSYAPANAVIPARLRYTVTQDLWELVVIRPASRTVKLIRFGAGADRAFSY